MNAPTANGVLISSHLRHIDAPIQRAGLWRRWGAYFIDSIVLAIANSLISILLTIASQAISLVSSMSGFDLSGSWAIVAVIITLAVPAIYFILPYSTGGQTLGKAILGIKVVSMDGSPLNWRKGILRTVGYIPSTLAFGLGFLWSRWDADKQAWHDKAAGTCVVRASVAREQLQGTIDPEVARQRQRRWLVGLGALTVVLLVAFGTFVQQGVSEVTDM